MRVLRTTAWPNVLIPGGGDPITVVVRDSDVVDTLESVLQGTYGSGRFVTFEIFDAPDGHEIEPCTSTAMQRWQGKVADERNQAVLYYFGLRMLALTARHGVWAAPDPAPLSSEQIAFALRQLVQADDYDGQTIMFNSAVDNKNVRAVNGDVEVVQ